MENDYTTLTIDDLRKSLEKSNNFQPKQITCFHCKEFKPTREHVFGFICENCDKEGYGKIGTSGFRPEYFISKEEK